MDIHRPRRIRLADIAERAHVSISSVSRALSSPDRLNPQTVERIRTVSRELGYKTRPRHAYGSKASQASASAHSQGKASPLVALIVKDTSNGISSQILKGAQFEARSQGRVVALFETGDSPRRAEQMLSSLTGAVDGLIIATDTITTDSIRRVSRRIPLVVVNRPVEGVRSIVPNPVIGVMRAMQLLRENGNRSIVYVTSEPRSWASRSRWQALSQMAPAMGLRIRQIGPVSPTVDGGQQAALALEGNLPSAIMTYNDALAAGVTVRLSEDAIPIPGKVSVIGFDDTMLTPAVNPPLTTIRIPRTTMGEAAVRLLATGETGIRANARDAALWDQLIEHGFSRPELGPLIAQIDTSLIVRGSVGPHH